MVLVAHSMLAASYYFSSKSGDDSRSSVQAQNPETPWKSIDKLNSVFATLKPGDVVYFKRDETYFGTINLTKSGTPGNPIRLAAYGVGAKPVITSLVAIDKWNSLGGGKYESQHALNTSEVSILLIDGQMQELGRYPNSNEANGGYITIESASGSSQITSKKLSSSPNWKNGQVVIKKNAWIIDTQSITSHSGNALNFTKVNSYNPKSGYGFFIQNHPQTLDKFGEWYYNTSNKKMMVFLGNQNPAAKKVQVTTLDHLLTKTYGASYLKIEGLHFKGSNKDAISIAGGQSIIFDQVTVENSGANGILSLSVVDILVDNSYIKNSYNNGIYFRYGNDGGVIRNTTVESTAIVPGRNQNGDGSAIGIYAIADNLKIENNVVLNSGYSGIHFGGNNVLVQNNFVDTFCFIKSDGGGIYSYGGPTNPTNTNRKVVNNIIVNAVGSADGVPTNVVNFKPLAEGIFLDDNTNGVELVGNTIANVTDSGIKMSNVNRVVVKDNTIYNAGFLITLGSNDLGGDIRNMNISNNILFSKYADQNAYNILLSHKNDISKMGEFNTNYFFRPFGDAFSIFSRFQDNAGKYVEKSDDLERWTKSYGKDKNSKKTTAAIDKFKVVKNIGSPKNENVSFDSNIRGIIGYDGEASWDAKKIKGGTLKMTTKKNGAITANLGSVKKDKKYLLQFNGVASKKAAIAAFLRQSGSPWQTVSPISTFNFGTEVSEFKVIVSPYQDEEKVILKMMTEDVDFTFWIDDLLFTEVEADVVDPDQNILFEYNATKSPKTIQLSGTYMDAKSKEYKGSVTIAPFSSVVLLRISGEPAKEVEVLKPTVDLVYTNNTSVLEQGGSLTLKANVASNGAKIQKVNFYYGLKLLATVTGSPYQTVWKDIPAGKHYIWASAVDDKGKEVNSQQVDLDIKAAKAASPIKDDVVAEGGNSSQFILHLNAGSNSGVNHEGLSFEGDQKNSSYYNSSSTFSNSSASKDALFQSERSGKNLRYSIPVPNGKYIVKTYHNELWFGKSGPSAKTGRRVFDISLEGNLVKKSFDLFVASGNKQTVLVFEKVEVTDGVLNLDLSASENNASISGISIIGEAVKETKPATVTSRFALYLNAGSNVAANHAGFSFEGDQKNSSYYNSSSTFSNSSASKDALFQTERSAKNLRYSIPVPNGKYTVKTYHNELWFGKSGPSAKAGRRVFDISLEGKLVKKSFDLFLATSNKQTVLVFEQVEVTDGFLNLDLSASENNATVSGVSIEQVVEHGADLRVETSDEVHATQAVLSENERDGDVVSLYPNPAKHQTNVLVNADINHILIHNMSGQLIQDFDPAMLRKDQGHYLIPLSNIPQGLYLVSLVGEKEIIGRLRLIVQD
jgi:predicted SAM-dependent methyltransferase